MRLRGAQADSPLADKSPKPKPSEGSVKTPGSTVKSSGMEGNQVSAHTVHATCAIVDNRTAADCCSVT